MSLFIGGLAFTDVTLEREVKLGVLAGSVLSALAGSCVLYLGGRRRTSPAPDKTTTGRGAT
jgi:NhaA family Na+:H+ antiporter